MGKQPKRGGAGTEYKEKPAEEKQDGTVVKQWQRMPTAILHEWAQGQKRPKPYYSNCRAFEKGLWRKKVTLPDPKDDAKNMVFEPNRDADSEFAAKEDAAMAALLRLCTTLPLERKLPDGYRETWLEAVAASSSAVKPDPKPKAKGKAKDAKADADAKASEQKQQDAPASNPEAQEKEQWGQQWQNSSWSEWQWSGDGTREVASQGRKAPGGPLAAMNKYVSRAEQEREQRETQLARVQQQNKRRAAAEAREMANALAPALLSRRMRQQLSEALNLEEEFEAWQQQDLGDALSDAEAKALQICSEEWGFETDQAERALAAVRADGSASEAVKELAEQLRVWLCLHLPEDMLPESFAAGKGQFEVLDLKAGGQKDETSRAAEQFFKWLQAKLKESLGGDASSAEALLSCVEMVLQPLLEPGAAPDPEADAEALQSAADMLEPEDVEEAVISEMKDRWAAVLAARAEAAALSATETTSVPDTGATESEEQNDQVVEEPRGRQQRGAKRPRLWFGWNASAGAAGEEVKSFYQSDRGAAMRKFRDSLPAAKVQQELDSLLRKNQVVLVHGETGSGKTTQVGQFLLEAQTQGGQAARIVVTQPRRFAAVSVATRVAEERGERLGDGRVGYLVRGESKMRSDRCQLLFCTLGVLLRRLVADGVDAMFGEETLTHLVLDEVHERSMDMDFVLTLLRYCLPHRPKLRVLLMSATMDVQTLGQLFPREPPVVAIPGRTFPVQELHLDDVEDLLSATGSVAWGKPPPGGRSSGGGKDGAGNEEGKDDVQRPPGPVDFDLIADLVCGLVDGRLAEAASRRGWPVEGAILIFMPGVGEINRMIAALERKSGFQRLIRALPLHGSLAGEQQRRCFDVLPKGGPRKVVVATNVAETSVTLPDVTVVVDSCRERRLTRDHEMSGLAPALLERLCAQDSLKQRRGRAGRTQRGVCFRLIPRFVYDSLPAATTPEIEALPLETLAVQVHAAGFEPKEFLRWAPSPPPESAISAAEALLKTIGALRHEDETVREEECRLTALGRHLAALPCDARTGRLVVLGAFLGCASAACAVAAWLSVRSPLLWAQDDQESCRDKLRRQALRGKGGSKSDHCFWISLVDGYLAARSRKAFCAELGLSFERMAEVEQLRTQLLGSLRSLGFNRDEADANAGDWRVVRAAVVAGLYPFVARVERPAARYQEGIGGAVQLESEAKELRYYVQGDDAAEAAQGGGYGGWRSERPPAAVRAFLHPSSLLFKEASYSCPYVAFSERLVQQQKGNSAHPTKLSLTGCSEASVYALLLFGGKLSVDHKTSRIAVDGWIRFRGGSTTVAAMLERLREEIDKLLLRKVEDPSSRIGQDPVARVVVTLLTTDGLG